MKFVQVVHSRVGRHSLRPQPALLETIWATPQNQSSQLVRCQNLWNCQGCCKNDFAWPLLGSNTCVGYAAHDITARRTHNQKCSRAANISTASSSAKSNFLFPLSIPHLLQ